ncbi:hypothetical protein MQC88_07070 [Luteimonas sp. 50]|uniref:Type IV pilin accessory protein n=1 Tax=Cognatiluteimonas sedimenti TaxID=2927791 RepID=A0ABT0A404_9GAMM|nr:hypothetical protein [Lysobacter sedimenti]MCJ0825716.1 hypothetical protein [Lysobacter sedimenti]
MTRWKAAGIHLAASTVVTAAALLAPMLLWYHFDMWPLSGLGPALAGLFLAVLLAGPGLTLMAYRAGKKTLRLDLVVIVLIQVAFLSYACFMLSRIRPVFLVAAGDHLVLVRAMDIDRGDLADAGIDPHALSWTGPRLVGLQVPGFEARDLLAAGVYARQYPEQPAFYIAYGRSAPTLLANASPVAATAARTARDQATITDALASLGRVESQVRAIPVSSRAGRATMLVDAGNGRPLRALPLELAGD